VNNLVNRWVGNFIEKGGNCYNVWKTCRIDDILDRLDEFLF
jgi:hypothetical protein